MKLWNEWRKKSLNGKLYKFLVLIKFSASPTFEINKENAKYKNMWREIFNTDK